MDEQQENPERSGPDEGDDAPQTETPTGAPEPGEEEQGPSGPPPESIPGDSGQVPNPQQN